MKLLIIFLGFLNILGIKSIKFEPYTQTGHEQFEYFEIPKGRRILLSYTENEINKKYNDVSKTFFGTRESYFDKYIPVQYRSTVIFSRSNKTRESYIFSYDLKTVNYKSVSVNVKGNINVEGVFKLKKSEITAEGDISVSYDNKTSFETTESGKMNVVIHPNKKITLRIVGEARITNGVSKYYFFGICFKKGAFEIVEVVSTIYELVEEDA